MKKMNNLFRKIALFAILCSMSVASFAQIEIRTVDDLKAVHNTNKQYILMNDIDLEGVDWVPIELKEPGVVDGNGYVVKNLFVHGLREGRLGLFSKMTRATIKNLGIDGAYVYSEDGEANGALVGFSDGGLIQNCWVVNAYVNGRHKVGGILGVSEWASKIENCYSAATVVARTGHAGGVVGVSGSGDSGNDPNSGRPAARIYNCYFVGTAAGNEHVGGIMGRIDGGGSVFADKNVSFAKSLSSPNQPHNVFRIISWANNDARAFFNDNYSISSTLVNGSTVAEGTGSDRSGLNIPGDNANEAFYTGLGWDFENTWKMVNGFPRLKVEKATTSPVAFAAPKMGLKLVSGSTLNLKDAITSQQTLTFTTTSNLATITEGVLSITGNLDGKLTPIKVTASATGFASRDITVYLAPAEGTVLKVESAAALMALELFPEYDIQLIADIDVTGLPYRPLFHEWNLFTKTFDGNNHVVKGININSTRFQDGNGRRDQGLLGRTSGATVKNVGIEDARIIGNEDVGGVIGKMIGGLLENCYVYNSYIEGRDHVGALVGGTDSPSVGEGIIRNNYANARVHSRQYQAGGLVGTYKKVHISNCYYSGVVTNGSNGRVAGLVSYLDASNDDPSTNSVKNMLNLAPYVMGSSGARLRIVDTGGRPGEIANNYSISTTQLGDSGATSGSTVPTNDANYGADKRHGANLPDDADALSSTFYTETLGWDFTNTWAFKADGGYPILKWQTGVIPTTLVRISTDVIILKDGETLDLNTIKNSMGIPMSFTSNNTRLVIDENNIATATDVVAPEDVIITATIDSDDFTLVDGTINVKLFAEGSIKISEVADLNYVREYPSLEFELMNDLDLTGVEFTPLSTNAKPFTGSFEGNGHVITGMTINSTSNGSGTSYLGLFGASKGTIRNLGLENARVVGNECIGGIVGEAQGGKIEYCYVTNSYIETRDRGGAIAGRANGGAVIENCYASAQVVASEQQKGGIVGATNGDATIKNSYFSGTTAGGRYSAGFLGLLDSDNDVVIENNLNLSPSLSGASGLIRRIYNGRSKENVPFQKAENNWSLSSTIVYDGIVAADDVNATLEGAHGKNLANDSDAKSETFYDETLGWDFEDVWTLNADGYPVFQWQESPINVNVYGIAESYRLLEGESIDLSAILNYQGVVLKFTSNNAALKIEGNKAVVRGLNATETAQITISANDAFNLSTTTFDVKMVYVPGSDASLKALTTSAGTLTPAFAADVYEYAVTVPNAVSSIEIEGTATDPKATVVGNGPRTLQVGETTATIKVVSESGEVTQNYVIKITRLSNDATLKTLTVSAGTLTPAFASDVYEYAVTVPHTVASIDLAATANHAKATVAGVGTKTLTLGANPFTITVTAEDGSKQAYVVTVTRQGDPSLATLTVSEGTLSPEFASDVYAYTVTVPYTTSTIVLAATASDANATFLGTGLKQLQVGANTLVVTVTAVDGTTTQQYTVVVTRQEAVGVDAVNASVVISTANRTIKAQFNGDATVKLYSIAGKLMYQESVYGEYTQAVEQGIYVLVINNKSYKVVVK